jgi:hypothetical protein
MTEEATKALVAAAEAGGLAPSIHNTQPWRWIVDADGLELHAETSRHLAELDAEHHLLMISCGAALHHALVDLLAAGWRVEVERPAAKPLARVRLTGRGDPDPVAVARADAAPNRHADRRPVAPQPVPAEALKAVTGAMRDAGVEVHVLRRDQVIDLASAVSRAQRAEETDERQRAELAAWVGGERSSGVGVPDAAIPDAAPQTTVPGRDFGVTGSLPPGAGHDEAAVFAVLYGRADTAVNWLRAGEALAAGWLDAVRLGLTLLPFSAPVEIASTRHLLREMVADIGYPYLVVRLGVAVGGEAPRTPRLPAEQTIEIR